MSEADDKFVRARPAGGSVTHLFDEIVYPPWRRSVSLCGKAFIVAGALLHGMKPTYFVGRKLCVKCDAERLKREPTNPPRTT